MNRFFKLEARMTKSCKAMIDANAVLIGENKAASKDQLERISAYVARR